MSSWRARFESLKQRLADSWALWSILAAQATLTLPWMWRTAAYTDESIYVGAGHLGWAQSPFNVRSFPGLPVLYPPIAAALESVGQSLTGPAGGLIAARLLSLGFMLGATAMVYLIGDRMFGRIPGILAALLFAVCGIVVHLGAAATFDPMALFLLVLALYAAVRMRDGAVYWILICPVALAAANATKYSTAAFDPMIVGTVILYGWSKGRVQAILLAVSVAVTTAIIDLGILALGGDDLAIGVRATALESSVSGVPTSWLTVLDHAALMTGLIVLIAIAGVLASLVKRMPATATAFLCLLVLAAFLAPIEQARAHELASLDENMGFGLPFAALAAGYALGAWRQWLGRQRHWGKVAATTAAVITVISMLMAGRLEGVQFRGPGTKLASTVSQVVGQKWVKRTWVFDDSPTVSVGQAYENYLPAVSPLKWLARINTPSLNKNQWSLIKSKCVSIVVLVPSKRFPNTSLSQVLRSTYNFRQMSVGDSPHAVTILYKHVDPPTVGCR